MDKNITEYGPQELAEMLAPMRLAGVPKLTFHSELADRVNNFMKTDNGDFVIDFLKANDYLWPFDVENSTEKRAYILTKKGMDLLRKYL